MYGNQTIQASLHCLRKGLIGQVLIGEQCVPAIRGNLYPIQDRTQWGLAVDRSIGMPMIAGHALVARQAPDLYHRWIITRDEIRVDVEFSELPREALMLFDAKGLITEKD